MAKAISDEELQLKKRARRRLVGAVALVLVIVVFLPMVLDNEPKPLNQEVAIAIPPIPKPESASQLPAPLAEAASASPAAAQPNSPAQPPRIAGMPQGAATDAQSGEPARAVTPEPAKASEGSKPQAPKTQAKPAAKPQPRHDTATPAAGGGDEGFVVQLGAFSNAANAKALQKKLQDNKFKAYTELVRNSGGDRTRVRVGPYPSRETAEKARERLKSMKLIIGDAAVVRQD